MRHARATAAAAVMLTALAAGTAGCGGSAAVIAPPAVHSPAGDGSAAATQAGARQAEIYEQVLRRYLGTPAENSFPGRSFKTVYVLDQAYADAADPAGSTRRESRSRRRRSAR